MPLIKLSICIPTYNRGDLIGECLEHIARQASSDVEIVIVDGASTDNTPEVVARLQSRHQCIRYFRQDTNGGIDRDMARTIELAQGEYCWLFGSDDIMLSNSIGRILVEIANGFDLYLCGFTLCTREMIPIADHHIWSTSRAQTFELSSQIDSNKYFALARTTTALFSFLGSIVVRRQKWLEAPSHEQFIGSCWSHVARLFAVIPTGLSLRILPDSYLLNRGDNDSFLKGSKVNRVALSVNGYLNIGEHYFGTNSKQTYHIARVLRHEWPLIVYLKLHDLQTTTKNDRTQLTEIFLRCFSDTSLSSKLARIIYKSLITRVIYRASHRLKTILQKYILH